MTTLDNAKMPSLKDKIRSQEVEAVKEVVKEVKVKKEDTKVKKVEKGKK